MHFGDYVHSLRWNKKNQRQLIKFNAFLWSVSIKLFIPQLFLCFILQFKKVKWIQSRQRDIKMKSLTQDNLGTLTFYRLKKCRLFRNLHDIQVRRFTSALYYQNKELQNFCLWSFMYIKILLVKVKKYKQQKIYFIYFWKMRERLEK